jgi:hypothetical protein
LEEIGTNMPMAMPKIVVNNFYSLICSFLIQPSNVSEDTNSVTMSVMTGLSIIFSPQVTVMISVTAIKACAIFVIKLLFLLSPFSIGKLNWGLSVTKANCNLLLYCKYLLC